MTTGGNCFKCGQPGHWSRNCDAPRVAPVAAKAHPPTALEARPDRGKDPAFARRPVEEIGDPLAHAAAIRAALGWPPSALGEDTYDSAPRRYLGLRATTETRLRELARRQLTERIPA